MIYLKEINYMSEFQFNTPSLLLKNTQMYGIFFQKGEFVAAASIKEL